jgi:hypothetical protein
VHRWLIGGSVVWPDVRAQEAGSIGNWLTLRPPPLLRAARGGIIALPTDSCPHGVFPRSFGSGARPRPQQLGLFGRVPSVMTVGLLRSHRMYRRTGLLDSDSKWTGFRYVINARARSLP